MSSTDDGCPARIISRRVSRPLRLRGASLGLCGSASARQALEAELDTTPRGRCGESAFTLAVDEKRFVEVPRA